MNDTHTLEIIPRHSEVDPEGRVKIRAIFDYIQEAAAQHAEILGCGMRYLATEKKIWVLSRLRLACARPLKLGERLSVLTYPRNFDKLFALRPLAIRDEAGNEVLTALTAWLLLDTEKLRILRPEQSLGVPLPDNSRLPAYFDTPQKPRLPEGLQLPEEPVIQSTVRNAQIDLNRHLNNAEYALYTHSALARLIGRPPQFADLTVNFQKATQDGETLLWYAAADQGTRQFFVQARDTAGEERFSAQGLLL